MTDPTPAVPPADAPRPAPLPEAAVNDKITDLAKSALEKDGGWIASIIILLWGWWMSYKLTSMTAQLRKDHLDAMNARLDAMQAEQAARLKGNDEAIALAAARVKDAHVAYVEADNTLRSRLAAIAEARTRLEKLSTMKELDDLAKGK